MTITLTPELAALVDQRMKTGRYPAPEAVIGEALTHGLPLDGEAKADAMEDFLARELDEILLSKDPRYPTAADVEAKIETRPYRMGVGNLFVSARRGANVRKLAPMPSAPTLADFFEHRFGPANHVLQSAALAMQKGLSEEIVLACLLHDTAQAMVKTDHGYWAAQLYAPYVPEKTAFAIQYHQALRFFPDPEYGYEYPDLYRRLFGEDYVPLPHIQADAQLARGHKWYFEARMVTVNDFYAFDPNAKVTLDPFLEIVARHFRQPKEGLGNDGSPVAHMWRTIANPDTPL